MEAAATAGSDELSADQIAAAELGKQTQLSSLELSLEGPGLAGDAEGAVFRMSPGAPSDLGHVKGEHAGFWSHQQNSS